MILHTKKGNRTHDLPDTGWSTLLVKYGTLAASELMKLGLYAVGRTSRRYEL